MTRPTSFSLHFTDTEKNIFYSFEHSPFKLALIYISKIADSTISAGVSKNSYSKARCVCNASIIFMEPPSNLRNIHDSNTSFDITITFPFYLKYSQTVLQDLSKERTFSKNSDFFTYSRLFALQKQTYVRIIGSIKDLNPDKQTSGAIGR